MNKNFKPENQGEGDRESARRYNQNAEKFAHSGDVDQAAEKAKTDLEGPEGDKLREAEQQGKKRIAEEDPQLWQKGDDAGKKLDPERPSPRSAPRAEPPHRSPAHAPPGCARAARS
jgi:hypothetical protein